MKQDLVGVIINPLTRNRIKREFDFLLNKEISIEDNFHIKQHIGCTCYDCMNYVIEFKNLKDKNYYKFVITNHYPFKPPKLYINNRPLDYYYEIKNSKFNECLKKYMGIECFCCETILCSNNWGPQFTINSILDEIDKFRNYRYEIIIRILVGIIKRKYLIDDINIIGWLY